MTNRTDLDTAARFLNGLRGTPAPRDNEREPEPPSHEQETHALNRMEDAYEKEMDNRWE